MTAPLPPDLPEETAAPHPVAGLLAWRGRGRRARIGLFRAGRNWGLPRSAVRPDEEFEESLRRAARERLGWSVRLERPAGQAWEHQGVHALHTEYWHARASVALAGFGDAERVEWLPQNEAIARCGNAEERELIALGPPDPLGLAGLLGPRREPHELRALRANLEELEAEAASRDDLGEDEQLARAARAQLNSAGAALDAGAPVAARAALRMARRHGLALQTPAERQLAAQLLAEEIRARHPDGVQRALLAALQDGAEPEALAAAWTRHDELLAHRERTRRDAQDSRRMLAAMAGALWLSTWWVGDPDWFRAGGTIAERGLLASLLLGAGGGAGLSLLARPRRDAWWLSPLTGALGGLLAHLGVSAGLLLPDAGAAAQLLLALALGGALALTAVRRG